MLLFLVFYGGSKKGHEMSNSDDRREDWQVEQED